MTEQTDKATEKPGKTLPAKKRTGKSRSPSEKRAKAPGGRKARTPGSKRAKATAGKESGAKEPLKTDKTSADKLLPDTSLAATIPADQNLAGGKPTVADAKDRPVTASPLAPDPATITFGSNRPIVAAAPKLPASSGLRFSGPSDGQLKASGPQPTSAKAGGLTFTSAKSPVGKTSGTANPAGAMAAGNAGAKATPGNAGAKATPGNPGTKATPGNAGATPDNTGEASKVSSGTAPGSAKPLDGKAPGAKTPGAKAPDGKAAANGEAKKSDLKPAGGAKAAGPTKPAIAPQTSGRRLEKERASPGFALALFGMAAVVGGLAFWFNRNDVPPVPQNQLAAAQPAAPAAPSSTPGTAPEFTVPTAPEAQVAAVEPTAVPTPIFEPSLRAPETPGPLAGNPRAGAEAAPDPDQSPAEISGAEISGAEISGAALTVAEIGEIQSLLSRLELDPGAQNGVLSNQTSEAIRSYQDMAGLPTDGQADKALLDELRSVVALYGG